MKSKSASREKQVCSRHLVLIAKGLFMPHVKQLSCVCCWLQWSLSFAFVLYPWAVIVDLQERKTEQNLVRVLERKAS